MVQAVRGLNQIQIQNPIGSKRTEKEETPCGWGWKPQQPQQQQQQQQKDDNKADAWATDACLSS